MYEVTKSRVVEGTISIWAIPKKDYKDGKWILTGEWSYVLKSNEPYQDGTIKLQEFDITQTLAAGLPFIEKAVDTLKAEITKERVESYERISKLQTQVESLQLITHVREPYDGVQG